MRGMDEDEMLRGGKMVAKIPGEPMFIPRELYMMTRSIDTIDPNSHLFPLHLDKHIIQLPSSTQMHITGMHPFHPANNP
jgi:hypothetical protein